jgi:hypothetical protein
MIGMIMKLISPDQAQGLKVRAKTRIFLSKDPCVTLVIPIAIGTMGNSV